MSTARKQAGQPDISFCGSQAGGQQTMARMQASQPASLYEHLRAHLHECIFGFHDSAKEEAFYKLKLQQRAPAIIGIGCAALFRGVYNFIVMEEWSLHSFGWILLEPVAPLPNAFALLALFLGYRR
eukprot:gene19258-25891_t